LLTILPRIFLGASLLLARKGGIVHRMLGILYMTLMVITAFIALFLKAQVGPTFLGYFGYIHAFCPLVLYSVPTALIAVKKGSIKTQRRKMILLYLRAIVIAGAFTLAPGR